MDLLNVVFLSMKHLESLFLLPLFYCPTALAQKQPNILWLTIEDTSPQFIGCYGNDHASTPVIDQLAREGVRFTNAFSTGTVCSPSRSCIITGVKTYKTGTGNHRSSFPLPGFIKGFPYFMQKEGYYTSNNSKTDYNIANAAAFTKEAWDESSGKAGWWNRKPGQPFFAVFNFVNSHQSRTMTESYSWYEKNVLEKLKKEERIGENSFEMPPFYRDSPEMRKQLARVYNSLKLTDNEIGELLSKLDKDHLRDSTIIFFFADHGEGIPRGKTNGINLGHRVPFIVWFPEMYKDLSPWGAGGMVTGELVSFEDLAPTMIHLAGSQVPSWLTGRILMGKDRSRPAEYLVLSSDRADNGIDLVRSVTDGKYFYSRNLMPFVPEMRYIRYMEVGEITQEMRKDHAGNRLNVLQRSLFQDRPPECLFNIEEDIWETRNLTEDHSYQPTLEKMRSYLRKEIIDSRDIMLLPEYEIGMISQTRTPYEYRLNDRDYPVENIAEAAWLSGFKGTDIAGRQAEMMANENRVIRYWGIIGMKSQSHQILTANIKVIEKAMEDSYPPVAVTAAAISFNESGNKQAEDMLKKYCACDNPDLALMAINYLIYCKNRDPFIETIKQVHQLTDRIYTVKAACMDFLGSMGLVPNTMEFEKIP